MIFVIFTTMQVCGLRSTPQVCIRDGKMCATYGMVNGIYVTVYYTVANVYIYSCCRLRRDLICSSFRSLSLSLRVPA